MTFEDMASPSDALLCNDECFFNIHKRIVPSSVALVTPHLLLIHLFFFYAEQKLQSNMY